MQADYLAKGNQNESTQTDDQGAQQTKERVRINLNLSKENWDYVKAISTERKRTFTEQINRIIDRDRMDHAEYYDIIQRKREIEKREDI